MRREWRRSKGCGENGGGEVQIRLYRYVNYVIIVMLQLDRDTIFYRYFIFLTITVKNEILITIQYIICPTFTHQIK
jgi:hypothetical protein